MKYIKPHLSPELRAQITPANRRDRKLAVSGVIFLLIAVVLTINLIPNGSNNQVSIREQQLSNNEITPTELLEAEKQILGLSTQEEPQPEPEPEPAPTATQSPDEFTTYTVRDGDTLFNISQEYNISWNSIAQINNLSEPYILHSGQTLKIPQATTSQITNKVYTIQSGDTLSSIAQQFNITTSDIIAVNPNLQKSDLITVGQIIKLP